MKEIYHLERLSVDETTLYLLLNNGVEYTQGTDHRKVLVANFLNS